MAVSATDWFENQPVGRTARKLWDDGYAFDYVSDAQLQKAKVAGGKVKIPGAEYRIIVVPECKYMPLETVKQLLALAKNGATIFFEGKVPSDLPWVEKFGPTSERIQKTFERAENP